MKRFAFVTILVGIDGDAIPSDWFSGVPEGAIYVADVIKNDLDFIGSQDFLFDVHKKAIQRKIEQDGMP